MKTAVCWLPPAPCVHALLVAGLHAQTYPAGQRAPPPGIHDPGVKASAPPARTGAAGGHAQARI